MDFGANKTPVEIIKEGAFGGSYFRDIYSGVNEKWYDKSWIEFDELKNIDQKFYCSSYYDVSINKYCVNCGTSFRFWENKGWINEIDPYGWFHYDERQINRWKKIVGRFRGKLVKMIKDAGSQFDDYSISPKIRQILLPWSYELTEKYFFNELTN